MRFKKPKAIGRKKPAKLDPKTTLVPGEWYYGYRCTGCGADIPMYHDSTGGKITFSGTGRMKFTCPKCGHAALYTTTQLIRFQIPFSD
jgi:predicted RNA-binding Zn-ribbon protein involved in translation (DUF1610 family)